MKGLRIVMMSIGIGIIIQLMFIQCSIDNLAGAVRGLH
jgi:hypothetical protein